MLLEHFRRLSTNLTGFSVALLHLNPKKGFQYVLDHEFRRAHELDALAEGALRNAEALVAKHGTRDRNANLATANADDLIELLELTNSHVEELLGK